MSNHRDDLAAKLSALSPEKRVRLKSILSRQKAIDGRPVSRDAGGKRKSGVPLSFAQQRLWFLDQLEPGSPFYNMPAAFRLKGALDIAALEKCFSEILRRHEVLRTRFIAADDEALQVIQAAPDFELSVIDLASLAPSSREAEALRFAHEEAAQPFSLSCGPVFRAHLVKLAADDHVLTINLHHIVSDNWSMVVLYRELGALYDEYTTGSESQLAALSIQYADYALWQRERLKGRVLDEQLAYWKAQLKGAPALLELPIDRPRPQTQKYHGAHQTHVLTRSLLDELKALSQANGATLFMTLLTAFKLLLARYTGAEDILVGAPVAGRARAETESLIGFFVNTLVLRTDCSNDPSFTDLLSRVRATCLSAYAHQDIPFEKLVEELKPERSLSYAPLVQVMFGQRNADARKLALRGLDVTRIELARESATFDLYMGVTETDDGLHLSVEYNIDLFEHPTITRLIGHYEALLDGIAVDPSARLSQLPLLNEAERNQLLRDWNQTQSDYPRHATVQSLFEQRTAHSPYAIGAVCEGNQLTYAELNAKANRLAHHLISLGVGPEVLVGICVERSIDMIVGLLAILKAGGAYLPLDPAYPKERLAFMLEDAKAKVLISQVKLEGELPEHHAYCVFIDRPEAFDQYPLTNPKTATTPDNLAYVIYTSGSTGIPKGVQIEHAGLSNLIAWHHRAYDVGPADRATQMAGLAFDASVWEIWPYLTAGASIHIPGEEIRSVPLKLVDWLAAERITLCFLPTPLAESLLDEPWPKELALRVLLTGGDRLHRAPRQALPFVLINHYGPTENTVVTTSAEVIGGSAKYPYPPIGRPIANTQIYILDRHLNPVPIGGPGELHISGAGLARGYLNRPELTAEKFIANPFSEDPDARLYKTGDLARYLPDGNIEFLGRTDYQVKIRGFRIELGEIEAVLVQHPDVRETAVIAREDMPNDKRLIAYVVPKAGAPSPTELRGFIQSKLPEYMIPAAFVLLDKMPVTPNGKLDRGALPASDHSRPALEATYVAPRTPGETTLSAIFAELLKLDRIGIHDNFFALGGHSLLATQVIARVRQALHCELPLRVIFESPTVEALGMEITRIGQTEPSIAKTAIAKRTPGDSAPLSLTQQRLWFQDQLEPGAAYYNTPIVWRLSGALDVAALARSLDEIVARHEVLRTSFTTVNEQPIQIIHPAKALPLTVVDLGNYPAESRANVAHRLAAGERNRPFDLSCGPLLRVSLARLGKDEHLLSLTMHHIISDGWSRGVLSRELSALYQAFVEGMPSPLAELPIQYADYAIWQRQWLQGQVLEQQLAYWKQQLGDDPPVMELPIDWPRPPLQNFHGAAQSLVLSEALSDALRSLSQREGVTLFMTLLAAFQLLLCRLSGQNDILVGTPVAGRSRIETEGLIGFFISTLVLRTDLSGNPSFKELLSRVNQVALGAYAHQELPFEKLVEELQPKRSLSRNPIFDVLINFNNAPQQSELQLPGISVEPLPETAEPESQFAMTLYIRDDGRQLTLRMVYQSALFSVQRIVHFLDQLKHLFEQIVAAPEQPIGAYSLVTPAMRALLPDPSEPIPEPQYVLTTGAIADWARRAPMSPAVHEDGQVWSYGELWDAAQAIARALRDHGVRRSDVVAISGVKSFGLIAAMTGTLSSGGVMLTLDRNFPAERQKLLVREVGVAHVLYVGEFRSEDEWMRDLDSTPLIYVDADGALTAQSIAGSNSNDAGLPALAPDDPACIFFTSGTSGVPKGILGCHKSLSHFLAWQRETFAIGAQDRIAQLTALSFDVLLRDVFLPLTCGASVHLPDEREGLAPDYILPWLAREEISVLHTVPALAQSWLSGAPRNLSFPDLRWVFFSGEPLQDTLIKRWRDTFSLTAGIVNLYGPTETTMVKCFHRVGAEQPFGIQPVGRPLPQTQALAMNASGQLCGIGEPGEIAIRTPFRTLGYVNAPDENRKRFVKNPFRDDDDDLLYLTGDRGRYRPDGTLMMEGRLDDQVKINGVRVEPSEAGAILAQHEALHACFVMARKDQQGENFLAAYVVAKSEVKASELRAFLSSKLPAPLVPSAFVFLDSLPLTANGKVDRKALPAPERSIRSEQDFVAPRTPNEQTLAAIWAEVLKLDKVGVHDSFFELGGHSLLATQVIARVRTALHCELPLRALFEAPTIESLAVKITDTQMQNEDPNEMTRFLADLETSGKRLTHNQVIANRGQDGSGTREAKAFQTIVNEKGKL